MKEATNDSATVDNEQSEKNWLLQVEQLASQAAQQETCVLYDLEFFGIGQGRTLRVFIDKENGVGIEDCSNVSKALNELLDTDNVVPGGAYSLEVSTPGIDRNLRQGWHFDKVVGKKIWVKSKQAFEDFGIDHAKWAKAKQIEHVLTEVEPDHLIFKTKEVVIRIPKNAVEKAKVVFEMTKGQKK
ncbi:MAG: ribosome maturation factor RimP [Bdellovibrionota bacterium]